MFNIDSATGEVTFKAAPNYEAPTSISSGASSIGTAESDFASIDQNQLRGLNQYRIKVIGNDGSGEATAIYSQDMYIYVRSPLRNRIIPFVFRVAALWRYPLGSKRRPLHRIVSYRIASHKFVSYRIVSHRIVPYRQSFV